jgi:predicted metalloprotease with PDZ domain
MRRLFLILFCACAARAETEYEIDLAKAASHILVIRAAADCRKAACDFQMPVWNALYQVRDFSQYVSSFEAFRRSGEPLAHHLASPSLWRVEAAPGERIQIRYQYFADSPGPFGCSASSRHLFLNPAQALVYPVDGLREPMTLTFRNKPAAWKVAMELPERGGVFRARNYDELADAPAELSHFAETSFTLAGRRLRLAVDGNPEDYDLARLEATARRVASAAVEIMQDVPFPSYTFIYHFRKNGGGGMEHANSAAIDAPAPCRDCSLEAVTAHEFFHLWNVKRIRPQSLEPVDYTRENITPSLWFSEGVTSTYAEYILLQSGLQDAASFLKQVEDKITRYEERPARLTQSAEESSVDAWLERYPYYGRPSRSVSYYLKGELVGYLLDLAIRHASANRRSLDDVMRRLNEQYAQKGKYFEDTAAIERLSSEAAGRDLKGFFDSLVRRPAPIPWNHYLGFAGYRVVSEVTIRPTLGIETARGGGPSVVVAAIEPDGPGERAGLQAGDRLVAMNRRPLKRDPGAEMEALSWKPGAKILLDVERRDERITVEVTPEPARRTIYRIEENPHASAGERALRASWLRSPETAGKP